MASEARCGWSLGTVPSGAGRRERRSPRSTRALGYPAPVPVLDLLRRARRGRRPRCVADLRWGALTAVMTLLSAWWVKGVAIAAIGGLADLRRRPRAVPWTAAPRDRRPARRLAGLRPAQGRLRPRAPRTRRAGRDRPGVRSPPTPACRPATRRRRRPRRGSSRSCTRASGCRSLSLVAAIGLSRVYLGVHYPSDVLAGLALGPAVAWLVVAAARRRVVRAPARGWRA